MLNTRSSVFLVASGALVLPLAPLVDALRAPPPQAGRLVVCDSIAGLSEPLIKNLLGLSTRVAGVHVETIANDVSILALTPPDAQSQFAVIVGRSPDLSDNVLVGLVVGKCFFKGGTRDINWGWHYPVEAREQWNRLVAQAPTPPRIENSGTAVNVALGYLTFATGRLLDVRSETRDAESSSSTVTLETASGWMVNGIAWDNRHRFEIRLTRTGRIESVSVQ